MAFFRHLLPLLTGAALGCAATLLAQRYAQQGEPEHIVGPEAFDDAAEPAAPAGTPVYPVADDSAVNPNPVQDHTDPVPTTEDGKMDPTAIAKPEDFADWDDLGCQG